MFDREDFDRQFNRTRKTIDVFLWIQIAIMLLVVVGITAAVYVVGCRLLPLIEDVLRSMAA